MKLEELNERNFVFFRETLEKLLTPDSLMLGCLIYSNDFNSGCEGRKYIFPANIVYVNDEGVLTLANDYFYNAGLESFDSREDGISAGHYFDNWSDSDIVIYSEKPAPMPEELRAAIEKLNPEEVGILRQDYLEEISKLAEIYQADKTEENLENLDSKISEFFCNSLFGEKYTPDKKSYGYFCSIKFTADEESIKEILTFNDPKFDLGGITPLSTDANSKLKVAFTPSSSNDKDNKNLSDLTDSGLLEFVSLVEDQTFLGLRQFREDFDSLDAFKELIKRFNIQFKPKKEASSPFNIKTKVKKDVEAQAPVEQLNEAVNEAEDLVGEPVEDGGAGDMAGVGVQGN